MYVNPGELKSKISIVCNTGEKNENGFPVGEKVIHECHAKFTRKTGKEKDEAATQVNEVQVRFLIRYTAKDISRDMTVIYKNRRYDIQDINDIAEEHKYIELFCVLGDL